MVSSVSGNPISKTFKSLGGKFTRFDKKWTSWMHKPATSGSLKNASGLSKVTAKAGFKLNTATYKASNTAGKWLLGKMGNQSSTLGKVLSKVPGLNKLASGLTKVGSKGAKIPGIGTLFAVGTGVIGLFKAGGKLLKGDWKAAGHEIMSTGGSIAGLMAGLACMAIPGIGWIAGLGLAIGTGFAGDWIGKKAGNAIFGKMDKNGHSESWNKKHNMTPQLNDFTAQQYAYASANSRNPHTGQNLDYQITGVAAMNDQELLQFFKNTTGDAYFRY
jgi:hypothetical protein